MVTDDMAELGKLAAAGSRWSRSLSLSYSFDVGSKILLGNLRSRCRLVVVIIVHFRSRYCPPVGSRILLGTQGSEMICLPMWLVVNDIF